MAEQEAPRGKRRVTWNVVIVLVLLALAIGLFIALLGGGGTSENEQALLTAPLAA